MGKEYMRWIILVALILAGIACAIHDDVEIQGTPNSKQSEPVQNGTAKGIKILLIGSSYFNYNQLDQILTEFCSGGDRDVMIVKEGDNGLYLADHARRLETANRIRSENWDFVILQGVGTLTAYPDIITHHPVLPALAALKKQILDHCSSTRIIFCMPWAFEDGMAWQAGWTDQFPEMQQKIYENTLAYTEQLGLMVAPVGWAWNQVLMEKGFPKHYLHLSDWNHPSLRGSYLMAAVLYSTLFKEGTTGITYHSGLDQAEALYFRQVGSEIVLNSLELWRIN